MRPSRLLPLLAFAAFALVCAGCFGGSGDSGGGEPNLDEIPTATLPAELPVLRILGESAVSTGGRRTYTIQAGDTFSGIADQFGITLEELIAANPDVDPTSLVAGDVITLPEAVTAAPPAATATPGEAPVEEEPTVEAPVEEIPTDTPVPVPTEPPPPVDTPTAQSLGTTYVVQAGDTFATIAAQFGITIEALAAANPGVDSNNLSIGQVLMLPPAGG